MSGFVVDASVALKWVLPEEHTDAALRLLNKSTTLMVPDLFYCETGNALWKRVKRGDIDNKFAEKAMDTLLGLEIESHPVSPFTGSALKLALNVGCTVYDALYLVLAIEIGHPLITADRRFYNVMTKGPATDHIVWIEEI